MTVFVTRRRVITDIDELVDTIDSARTAPKTLRPGAIRAEVAHAEVAQAQCTGTFVGDSGIWCTDTRAA